MYKEWISLEDHSKPYITCNSLSLKCRHIWNYNNYQFNPNSPNHNWLYFKTDYLKYLVDNGIDNLFHFLGDVPMDQRFVIFTGNSDYLINESYLKFLDDPRLIKWFGVHTIIQHPKLVPIAYGLANAGYEHGDMSILTKVINENNEKADLFYANYNEYSNLTERRYCLEQTGVPIRDDVNGGWMGFSGGYKQPNTYEGYLRDLSRSYFSISPQGNGPDAHRTWESIYVGCIPIVTSCGINDSHKHYPMIVLNDWSEFKNIKFDAELYNQVWNNFNIEELYLDNYVNNYIKPRI